MCTYFKTKADVAHNLEELSKGKILNEKKYGGTRLISEKTEALYAEPNERVEAAINNFSSI